MHVASLGVRARGASLLADKDEELVNVTRTFEETGYDLLVDPLPLVQNEPFEQLLERARRRDESALEQILLTTTLSPWQILTGKIYSSLRISVVLTSFLVWPLLLAWTVSFTFYQTATWLTAAA